MNTTPPPFADDRIIRLKAMSTSPHEPEPPRRSFLVEAIIYLSRRRPAHETPHYSGASDLEKLRYEYAAAGEFWTILGSAARLETLRNKDVLDVGCGWGGKVIHTAEHARPRRIVGFDLPGIFLPEVPEGEANRRGLDQCAFFVGYAEQIPWPDKEFDYVMMEDVLEHVSDPEAVIRECWRVLRPGGRLLARFPSIRMLNAHHFDRALALPGLHYIASFRTWAAGLNYHLLETEQPRYEPFSRVGPAPFHREITGNLNGLTMAAFRELADRSPLEVEHLSLAPAPERMFQNRRAWLRPLYDLLRSLPRVDEAISRSIVFVGRRST